MKKLTIEEKAKAYDKAIERAKRMFSEKEVNYLFPEFKESNDEKIRKVLRERIIRYDPNNEILIKEEGISQKQFLDWIERQGEHKKFRDGIQVGDKVTRNRDGMLVNLSQLNRVAKKDEKQGEQKSTEWNPQPGDTFRKKGTKSPIYHLCNKREDGINFGFVEERENGVAGGEISIFALKNEYELIERMKPIEKVIEEEFNKALQTKVKYNLAWSEEDEKRLQSCLNILQAKGIMGATETINTKWLKSLKDRVQSPPKQEWSEEDENAIHVLKDIVKHSNEINENIYTMPLKEKLYDWLKSLKDRVQEEKSSNGHYELEEFAKIVRDNLVGISRPVIERFEDKYLQLTGNKMFGGFKD